MEPIPAVGLTSVIVQLLDFAINVLRNDHPIFQSADPRTPPVENAVFLQNVINNLFRLTDAIDYSKLKKLSMDENSKLSEPAQTLLRLSDHAKEATNPLIDALITTQAKGSFGDPQWPTARDALTHVAWKKKQVTDLKKKLRTIRRDVDTALLLAMRQYLDQSAEAGLTIFSEDAVRMHHYDKWQNAALDAIHTNDWKPDWKPKGKKIMEEFAEEVDKLVVAEKEAHFRDHIFERLGFEELNDRFNSVAEPLDGTFEWVFEEAQALEGGLLEWFGNTRGENMFWITGSPGSGKTTLMKYLFRNPRVFDSLEAWSGQSPGITSGFFFWNCGTELQKSAVGVLRSLLFESLQDMIYGPLEQDQSIIQALFADRWSQFTSYGGGLHEFSFVELLKAFELMIADDSKKFLFMIDGLDEMDRYSNELPDIFAVATKMDHVKICVSCRPTPLAQTAMEKRPKLNLDMWNKNDIQLVIMHAFDQDNGDSKLHGATQSPDEVAIVDALTEKASGSFLWATLATHFLIQRAAPTDNFGTFQTRAYALPPELDALLAHILQSLPLSNLETLWKTSSLLEAHRYPSLLPLSFALTVDQSAAIAHEIRPLRTAELTQRTQDMRTLLRHTYLNLISIFDTCPPDEESYPTQLKITYTHRTIRDYMLSPAALKARPILPPVNTDAAWSAAHLMVLKTTSPTTALTDDKLPLWAPLSWCLETALAIYTSTALLPTTYLSAAGATALYLHTSHPTLSDLPAFPSLTHSLTSFLDIAAWLNLPGYVVVKAAESERSSERKEVRHALEYSREMRRRVGKGGEEKWVKGRERLKGAYTGKRSEVEGVLEWYGRAIRLGTRKPSLEVPECV